MQEIKKIIEQTLKAMGFDVMEIDIKKDNSLKDRELLNINLKIDPKQAECFIKENGWGLNAFQHLLRVLISKKYLNQTFFILDINNYRKEREKFLIELVLKTAQEVRKNKKSITLESMSSYERRLIHLKLAEQSDIVTESIGIEPERKVVVKPYP